MQKLKPNLNLIFAAFAFAVVNAWASDLPDSVLTPGAVDPGITQDNIQSTICVKGYTKTVRPPASYTNKLKKQQIREYGYDDANPKHYEEDHLISLELGGHPQDPKNLWPEPWISEWNAKKKDELENKLHRMVCDGEIMLSVAQDAIARDWVAAYKNMFIETGEATHANYDPRRSNQKSPIPTQGNQGQP
jgi:hypothetical protein